MLHKHRETTPHNIRYAGLYHWLNGTCPLNFITRKHCPVSSDNRHRKYLVPYITKAQWTVEKINFWPVGSSYPCCWTNHYGSCVLCFCWCAILIAHQIVMAKHGGSCVHFSGISTCGRTSRETVSHSQRQPLPTPHKIALPVYVTVTNKRLQPLTTTLYNSLVLSFSLLITKRRLIKHRSFLRVLRSS